MIAQINTFNICVTSFWSGHILILKIVTIHVKSQGTNTFII